MLKQQIGKIETDRPLLILSKEAETKTGVLAGEGIWRWRLEDFMENGSHATVDGLVIKVVQTLSGKEDKRRFRVYPARSAFDESETVTINGELYNEAYELINTPDASLVIRDAKNKAYPFLFSKTGNTYTLNAGTLPPGEYSFASTVTLGKENFKATGKFAVNSQLVELRRTTADHQLLFMLASQSNGELLYPSALNTLPDKIKKNELVKTISYEDSRFREMIDIRVLCLIILALLSLEWFFRKRSGQL